VASATIDVLCLVGSLSIIPRAKAVYFLTLSPRKGERIMKKIAIVLTLAGFLGFVATSLVQSKPPPGDYKPIDDTPIWEITVGPPDGDGDKAVDWVDHEPNKRFAIYDSGTPFVETDDVVLDKETGLVWQRYPSELVTAAEGWYQAIYDAYGLILGGRKGWRLPTIEELYTLMDPTPTAEPYLPTGHPFVFPEGYFYSQNFITSTTNPKDPTTALSVSFASPDYS
jgi:hypothetical protein